MTAAATVRWLWLLVVLVCPATLLSQGTDRRVQNYRQWETADSRSTYAQACHYLKTEQTDSALYLFTIVANRYYQRTLDTDELMFSVAAMQDICDLYMSYYYDIQQANSFVLLARQIAEEHQLREAMPSIYTTQAVLTLFKSAVGMADHYEEPAIRLFQKAFHAADSIGAQQSLCGAFVNMVQLAHEKNRLNLVADEIEHFSHVQFTDSDAQIRYAQLLCKGITAFRRHDTECAIGAFREMLSVEGFYVKDSIRRHLIAHDLIKHTYFQTGRDTEALSEIDYCLKFASENDIPETQMDDYRYLAEYYQRTGNEALAEHYELQYLRQRNRIFKRSNVENFDNAGFLMEIRQLTEKVRQISYQRQMQAKTIRLVIAFSVVVVLMLIVLSIAYLHIRRNNRQLYQNNLQLLAIDEERRQALQNLPLPPPQPSPSPAPPKKYQKSALDEADKQQLLERVISVMDTSAEIFAETFTIGRLAELVDDRPNNVSQVINEKYGQSFGALLNDRRIKEACRRINDAEHYGQYTIEAIANSVGFRSRTSFVAIFKRIVGLTPSAYQRLAREEKR